MPEFNYSIRVSSNEPGSILSSKAFWDIHSRSITREVLMNLILMHNRLHNIIYKSPRGKWLNVVMTQPHD